SVVDAAQFNGSNLLKDASGTAKFDILSSLDRNSNQEVEASRISVDQQNLSTEAADSKVDYAGAAGDGSSTAYTITAGDTTPDYNQGDLKSVTVTYTNSGETKSVTVDLSQAQSEGDVQSALQGNADLSTDFGDAQTFANGVMTLDDTTNGASTIVGVSFTGNEAGMHSLSQVDVTDSDGAKHALASMEGFTQQAIDAAANFGQAQMRVETQMDFVGKLTDSLTAGVGSLVDA
ncbi:hypothetical protein CKO28_27175, partial [Rhodovibrio sodomensis]